MKRLTYLLITLLFLTFGLTGCDFVGDVIEFSLWTLLIVIVAIVLVIAALIKAFFD